MSIKSDHMKLILLIFFIYEMNKGIITQFFMKSQCE